jgi:hypothetical protein
MPRISGTYTPLFEDSHLVTAPCLTRSVIDPISFFLFHNVNGLRLVCRFLQHGNE